MAQSFGSAQIVLICHSHGGNVALSAIAGTHLGNVSVACLSTPFLRSRLRTLAASTTVVLHVLTFVLYAICAERLDSFVVWFSHSLDFIPLLVTLEIIGGAWLLWSYLSWLPESLYRFGAAFNQSVNFEVDQRLRLLIVRMTHDEASMGLVTSGFLEWLLNKYSRFVDGLVQNRRVLFIYFGAVVCLLITGKLEVVAQNRIVHMFLWPVLAAVIASLLLPTVFSFIALGADASIGIMTQSVSIDTTPIGHWEVNLFEPIQNVRGLAHSQTYSDERCVKLVVGWIKSHNQASAEVSMEFR
jgi:hypothetical protein